MGQICMKEVKVVEAPNTIPSTSESIVEEDVSFSKYEKGFTIIITKIIYIQFNVNINIIRK